MKRLISSKYIIIWGFASLLILISGGEVFARVYLGLGTPPLSVAHPTIEYMFKPDQDVYRFGNHYVVNQYGMRSEPFTKNKQSAEEYRVMVFGDSVINGGNLLDQETVVTTVLDRDLSTLLDRDVIVGNISAGTWGPGNWLAYAQEYGFFDADVVVLVVSSHDYADNPTFQPLNPNTHPTQKPISALVEGITRYLPRYLPNLKSLGDYRETDTFNKKPDEKAIMQGMSDLNEFLVSAIAESDYVFVVQHWEKSEIEQSAPQHGYEKIKDLCASTSIPCVSLQPYLLQAIAEGEKPYQDNIHLSATGHQLMAGVIEEYILAHIHALTH